MVNHTAVAMYEFYKKNNPGTEVTYNQYKYVLSEYNKKAVEHILNGETLNLGNRMGKIRIKKVKRNFDKPRIDYHETKKLRATGVDKNVYFTDEVWFRWYWSKKSCQIPNKSAYRFKPTGGDGGNRKRLVRLLKEDEFAQLNFRE